MSILLNTAALAAENFRSDRLGPLDSIAHPLVPGRYVGEVWKGDVATGSFTIDVAGGGDGDQIDIDLATIGKRSKGTAAFRGSAADKGPIYAVFHCDGGDDGLHVILRPVGERTALYDSRRLQVGDYYIVTLVRPATLTATLVAARKKLAAKAVIRVSQARPADAPRASASGATIVVGKDFNPATAEIVSGDGVVFEITASDIAIVLTPETRVRARGRRTVGVRYFGAAQTTATAPQRRSQ